MSTPKPKELFLASSLRDGLEDNNINQVTTLLELKEADPNVLLPMHGISPFHLVIGNESETFAEDVTRLFLRHGGDPNVKSIDGMTPVHVAAAWGRVNVLELLLSNGGDPLALDDEGRSPFHYAFDGSYYEAITVLGKYCTKRQEEDEDCSESECPQIQIKLEKILVNRGDVVAEYVPSEIDLTEDSVHSNTIAASTSEGTSSEGRESSSTSPEDPRLLQSDNITLRRYQTCKNRKISPILGPKTLIIDRERSAAEERILIGEIIHRISDSFNKAEKDNINLKEKESIKTTGKKKFCSLLPKPKYFKKDLETPKKKEKILPAHLDNSIISTSPNFRIGGLKREGTTPNQKETTKFKGNHTPNNFRSPSVKATSVTPKVRSASSTPKKKSAVSKIFKVEKRNNERVEETPLNKTYNKNNVLDFSPDVEDNLKMVNRRLLSKEFARRLEKSFDDEVEEKIENLKWKDCNQMNNLKNFKVSSINNNVELKDLIRNEGINKKFYKPLTTLIDKKDEDIIKSPVTSKINKKEGKNRLNVPLKTEGKKFIVESPGSSNPRSWPTSPRREFTGEEIKMWNEIDEIYREKGRTPEASISRITNDSMEEGSDNWEESSTTIDGTFSSDIGKCCGEDYEDVTKDSEDFDVYRTPLRSPVSSRGSIESFFSVDEEYAYLDPEKNVAFLERRLRVIPPSKAEDMNNVKNESTWIDMLERMSLGSTSSVPTSVSHSSAISVDSHSLRRRLIALGEAPGPITDTTFNVYLKRLRKLEKTVKLTRPELIPRANEPPAQFICPKNIPKELLSTDWTIDHQKYREIEHEAFKEYERPSGGRNYRGGVAKVSFNYLLLDPRVTNDLPRTGGSLPLSERWRIFLEAIFYIGKGKSARPAAHLYDAFDLWTGKKRNDQPSDKLKTILEIWKSGKGVISLQVFSNSMQEEAFTREAAMIDALGSSNLSNCLRGQYYGIVSTMNMREKRLLGKFLLYNAMQIFMHEGERQLFPRNVE